MYSLGPKISFTQKIMVQLLQPEEQRTILSTKEKGENFESSALRVQRSNYYY